MTDRSALIVDGIIERYRWYGWTLPETGEWRHINGKTRQFLREALERGDHACIEHQLRTLFRQPLSAGLASSAWSCMMPQRVPPACWAEHVPPIRQKEDRAWLYEHEKEVAKNTVWWRLYTDAPIDCLAAPDVGEPITADIGGVPVMADTPRHDHYADVLARLIPEGGTLLIIGGGYGGTARQMLLRRPDVHVVLTDLPETLYIAWYWLALSGHSVGWYDDTHHHDIVLVRHDTKWPSADAVLAAHCLPEMPERVVAEYMAAIRSNGARYFMHDSTHVQIELHPTMACANFPEQVSATMHPGAPYVEVYRAPTPWEHTGGRYWEFLYERRD